MAIQLSHRSIDPLDEIDPLIDSYSSNIDRDIFFTQTSLAKKLAVMIIQTGKILDKSVVRSKHFDRFAKVYAREMQKFPEFFGSRKFLLLK